MSDVHQRRRGNLDKVEDLRELDILRFARGVELGPKQRHVARGFGRDKEFLRQTVARFGFTELGRVIDLGCGYGRWIPFLAEVNERVTALDIQLAYLRVARSLSEFFELDNVAFEAASLFEVPAESATFDGVWIHSVSAWVNRARLLGEASRVVKPGGRMLLTLNGVGRMLQQLVTGYAAGGFEDRRVAHARAAFTAGPLGEGQPTYATRRVLPEILRPYGFAFDGTCPYADSREGDVSAEEEELLRNPERLLERFDTDPEFRELAVRDCRRLMRGLEYDIWVTATREAS